MSPTMTDIEDHIRTLVDAVRRTGEARSRDYDRCIAAEETAEQALVLAIREYHTEEGLRVAKRERMRRAVANHGRMDGVSLRDGLTEVRAEVQEAVARAEEARGRLLSAQRALENASGRLGILSNAADVAGFTGVAGRGDK
jgi:hypothetical protein